MNYTRGAMFNRMAVSVLMTIGYPLAAGCSLAHAGTPAGRDASTTTPNHTAQDSSMDAATAASSPAVAAPRPVQPVAAQPFPPRPLPPMPGVAALARLRAQARAYCRGVWHVEGVSRGGYGSTRNPGYGSGWLRRPGRSVVPTRLPVWLGTAETNDPGYSLDVIRRVERRAGGQLQFCGERAAMVNPAVAGLVIVQFTVGRDGTVPSAAVAHHELGGTDPASCYANMFRRLTFPAPANGPVVVRTPLFVCPRP